jgi:F0F1-type ATP synthase assembly protein I
VQLLPQRRVANTAVGDALAKAFEFAATVAIFVLIGYGLDWWLGTTPIFTAGLFLFVMIGQTVRLAYSYGADMRLEEKARRDAARAQPTGDEP